MRPSPTVVTPRRWLDRVLGLGGLRFGTGAEEQPVTDARDGAAHQRRQPEQPELAERAGFTDVFVTGMLIR